MPSLRILPPFFAHWLVFAATLLAYALWACGAEALRHGALPQNTAPLGEGGILLYTVAVTLFYTIGLTRLTERYIAMTTVVQQRWFYAGWLIDMSLFWLFAAYCLWRNYQAEDVPFFGSWALWTMLAVYLLLSAAVHFAFYPRGKQR
ncbi:MAG: hypothetical protein Q4G42_08515 [Neisseria sp.]|nr:hypothetical protein [Neisseria sp.]